MCAEPSSIRIIQLALTWFFPMRIALPLLTAAVWPMALWSQTPSSALPKAPQAAPHAVTQPRVRIAASAQRNENVAVYQIDNNAVKEANIRLGTRPTILQ